MLLSARFSQSDQCDIAGIATIDRLHQPSRVTARVGPSPPDL